jgi:hypothetical protein
MARKVVAVDLSEVEDLCDVPVAQRHRDAGLVDEHPDEGLAPRERRRIFLITTGLLTPAIASKRAR